MIDKANLIREIDASTEQLTATITAVDDNLFDKTSGPGWSPAEIAEHILVLETKVNYGLLHAHPTERPVDGKLAAIKQGLASFEKKYDAPDFVKPTGSIKDKAALIEGIRKQRSLLKQHVTSLDLSESCEMRHPVIGAMTRLEWVYFNIYHAGRHVEQMKSISNRQ